MLGCTNAHWPDIHGHYREAKFTQVLFNIITFAFIQVFFTLSHLHHFHSFSTVYQIHSWYKTPTFFMTWSQTTELFYHNSFILRRNTTGGGKRTRSSTELMSSAISTVRLGIGFFFLRDHDCFPRDRFVPGGGPLCVRGLPLRAQPDAGAGCRDAWKQGDIISIVTTNLLHILCLGNINININTINVLKYSQVDILCLGTYLRKFNPKATQKQVGLPWQCFNITS